jgi:uncharacterized protein YbjT (DUF2867 family)
LQVLLTGASGLIGSALVDALDRRGHRTTLCIRDASAAATRWPDHPLIVVDFARDLSVEAWIPRLAGIDIVVNAVGIFREHGQQTFDALHAHAPIALFRACAEARVNRVVQLSALGADESATSRYHRTKREADSTLQALPLVSTIVRPSLVFATNGPSARWFTALATLPVIPLPGRGRQCIQPVHLDDLVQLLVGLVESGDPPREVDAVGPQPTTLRDYLATLRASLGLRPGRFVSMPRWAMRMAAAIGGRVPGALVDREALQMLERGNCADAAGITRVLGHPPRATSLFVDARHADALRRTALLRWLLPLLRWSVAAVWIVTGIVSLGVYPVDASLALLARTGLYGDAAQVALYGAALLDLALGVATIALHRRRTLYKAQAAVIIGYTIIITACLPEYWSHPYGPVLKNLSLLAALWLLHELDADERA